VSQNAKQTTEQPQKSTRAFWDSCVGIGVCIFGIGFVIMLLADEISLRQSLTEANTGSVESVIHGGHRRTRNLLISHYVNGDRHTGRLSGIARGGWFIRAGAQIEIFYDPANPSQIRTNDIGVDSLAIWIVLIVLIPTAIIALISRIRNPHEEEAAEAPILTEEELEQDRKYRLRYTVKVGLAGFIIAMLSFLFLGAP